MRLRRRNAVLEALVRLRRAAPSINFTAALALLYVAENPGINIVELAEICETTVPTASRIARSLAAPGSAGALPPAWGLLEIAVNPKDPRGRVLRLSADGRKLCEDLEKVIAGGERIFDEAERS